MDDRLEKVRLPILFLALILLGSGQGAAQSGHRLLHTGRDFYLEDRATRVVKPFEMWTTRLANVLFDARLTDRVIACLDDYLRYGVNTVTVSLQGGEMGPNKNHLYPEVFHTDGSLKLQSPVYANLTRLLKETDRRGMVCNIIYWYHRRHLEVPDDRKALDTTRAVTRWLAATTHRNYFLDIVNEFEHYAFLKPGTQEKRPLFTTIQGALKLLHASKSEDPEVLAGMSPLSALLCPVGDLKPSPWDLWVEADILFGHGPILDPMNRAAYRLGVSPSNPLLKPYVNNEFFYQLRYELRLQTNPRTGKWTYGHWDRTTVDNYLADIRTLRGYHGSPNVYSHHQQYIPPEGEMPEVRVGPAGTQPEATPGGGEPSMHWLFRAVADFRGRGALPARMDFNQGHGSGLEDDLDGTWTCTGGRLLQTDDTADPAYARIAADEGEVEVAWDGAFLSDPGAQGRLGIHLGSATPAGPAYRLLVGKETVTLDQPGGSLPPRTVKVAKKTDDSYVLRLSGGRITVDAGGTRVLDVGNIAPIKDLNLLLLTRKARAAFDHVRITPIRCTDFEAATTGPWTPATPSAWNIVPDPAAPSNRVWEASVPAGKTRLAHFDRLFEDFVFRAHLDLLNASRTALRFRSADALNPGSGGYTLHVHQDGKIVLEHVPASGPAVLLGSASIPVNRTSIQVEIRAEGRRVAVSLNQIPVLDVVDAVGAPTHGRLQVLASPGRTRFDDICIEAGPGRFPAPRFLPGTGPPLPAGFIVDFLDPDGWLNLTGLGFEASLDGHTYVDLTLLLHPWFGLFNLALSPDGKGYRFTLRNPLPLGSTPWYLRAWARDIQGLQTAVVYKTL